MKFILDRFVMNTNTIPIIGDVPMPKIVFPGFLKKLKFDICNNYQKDDKYLSIREISTKFGVSIQTAQKGITELANQGMVIPKRKSGIFIAQTNVHFCSLKGKQLLVLSRIDNPLFFQPFLDGVLERTKNTGISTKLMVNDFKDITNLAFGEYLTSLHADGIITLNFDSSSALPFYHAQREQVDLISDIIIDELPTLPSVQTDNYKHAFSAGRMMVNNNITSFFVFGSYPEKNKRYIGFKDAVKMHAENIRYIRISEIDSMSIALGILRNLGTNTGVFLCDYTTVHYISSLCSRFNIQFPANSVIAYDGESNELVYPDIPTIPCVGPSFREIGYELCGAIVEKWETGKFATPLQRKI